MALSQEQIDFVTARTNERGAANRPQVGFAHTEQFGDGLNIIGRRLDDPAVSHGYTRKDTAGALAQATVNDDFRSLTDKTIDGMLRHF